jgi:hypothetical protein
MAVVDVGTYELRKLNEEVTIVVTVHETREFIWRMKAAMFFIHLAAWVLGMGFRVEKES